MPYNPHTNKYTNTTKHLNKERPHEPKNPDKLSDRQLIEDARQELRQRKTAIKQNTANFKRLT